MIYISKTYCLNFPRLSKIPPGKMVQYPLSDQPKIQYPIPQIRPLRTSSPKKCAAPPRPAPQYLHAGYKPEDLKRPTWNPLPLISSPLRSTFIRTPYPNIVSGGHRRLWYSTVCVKTGPAIGLRAQDPGSRIRLGCPMWTSLIDGEVFENKVRSAQCEVRQDETRGIWCGVAWRGACFLLSVNWKFGSSSFDLDLWLFDVLWAGCSRWKWIRLECLGTGGWTNGIGFGQNICPGMMDGI